MKAVVFDRFGGPEVLRIVERPRPVPGPGEVLVEVRASSVNPFDLKVRAGRARGFAPSLPAVGQVDLAGVVAACGPGVNSLAPGERVYGLAAGRGDSGALANLAVVAEARLAPMPERLDFAEAAALPLAGTIAWTMLTERARPAPGSAVLVGDGAGAGHLALQIARARGARVFATGSGEEACRIAACLGAEAVFDTDRDPAAAIAAAAPGGAGFPVVVDKAGGAALTQGIRMAAPGATVHTVACTPPADPMIGAKWLTLSSLSPVRLFADTPEAARIGEILRALSRMVAQDRLRPVLASGVFGVEQVAAAHLHAECEGAIGKVVVLWD